MDETDSEYMWPNVHDWPLMPFSHTQYPQSKANTSTTCEQCHVAAMPGGPNSLKTHWIKGRPDTMWTQQSI